MTRNSNRIKPSFSLPQWPPVLGGLMLTAVFYGLIWAGPLDFPWVRRFFMGHWVCVLTVQLFLTSIIGLGWKVFHSRRQYALSFHACEALLGLVRAPETVEPVERARWLKTLWRAQPEYVLNSWLGQRITELADRQAKRRSGQNLDEDLRDLAQRDSDRQYESYGLIRMSCWAMPMLGFLGTVLGISQTLGEMDAELLATQSQKAMDQLTAGLYVAFDTTALALVLTIIAMFFQFAVNRSEGSLLSKIDSVLEQNLLGFLVTEEDASVNEQEAMWKRLSNDMMSVMQRLVEQQTVVWRNTIDEAHSHWANLTHSTSEQVQRALGDSIDQSLDKHAKYLEQVQRKGAEAIDTRWHQWQLALSEQARAIHAQQKEIVRQSELLTKLVDTSAELPKMHERIEKNLQQLTNIDRFHEAAICMTEAVAILATQIERSASLQPRTPVRRVKPSTSVDSPVRDPMPEERRGKAA